MPFRRAVITRSSFLRVTHEVANVKFLREQPGKGGGDGGELKTSETRGHPYESLDILPSTPIESPYKRL